MTHYTLPLSEDQKDVIINSTSRSVGPGGPGMAYTFQIPKKIMGNLTPDDILKIMGYHPEGYGYAYDIHELGELVVFKCSSYSD
jgi:hypothetical protein